MTPHDLITLALKQAGVVGVGQTPLNEDANDALTHANMMLAQWNRRRWLVYRLVEVFTQAIGASSYRIGDGQAFDTKGRVVGIQSAFWRQNGQPDQNNDFDIGFGPDFGPVPVIGPLSYDIPLSVIPSREDYSRITMKGLTGFARGVWLDAKHPVGDLYVWPAPVGGTLHVVVQEQLGAFPDLTTDIDLPEEYREAIFYNLVVRLRSAYGKPADPVVVGLARAAMNTIRNANTQIGELQFDPRLPGIRAGFNIYSGDYN